MIIIKKFKTLFTFPNALPLSSRANFKGFFQTAMAYRFPAFSTPVSLKGLKPRSNGSS